MFNTILEMRMSEVVSERREENVMERMNCEAVCNTGNYVYDMSTTKYKHCNNACNNLNI